MEQAKNFEEFVKMIADELTMADGVYYDAESLQFNAIFDETRWEYNSYLEMSDEEFSKVTEEELGGWQRDEAEDLRKTIDLPHRIDKPSSTEAFHWMEEFTEAHAGNRKFFNSAVKALQNRHPFRGFRAALDWNGLTKDWYPFRDGKMQEYVRKEI